MPLTAKQQQFAINVAKGMTQSEAARAAGYSTVGASVRAAELVRHPEVAKRIAELRERFDAATAKSVAMDRNSILQNIGELIGEAREARDRATAMRGLELLGKAAGLFVDRRQEIKSPLDELSAEELRELLDRIRSMPPDVAAALLPGPASSPSLRLVVGGTGDGGEDAEDVV